MANYKEIRVLAKNVTYGVKPKIEGNNCYYWPYLTQ